VLLANSDTNVTKVYIEISCEANRVMHVDESFGIKIFSIDIKKRY